MIKEDIVRMNDIFNSPGLENHTEGRTQWSMYFTFVAVWRQSPISSDVDGSVASLCPSVRLQITLWPGSVLY